MMYDNWKMFFFIQAALYTYTNVHVQCTHTQGRYEGKATQAVA